MDQTKFSYPRYASGQVLKSSMLNDSFDYLEEQDRLTRTELCGWGILSGLECSISTSNSKNDIIIQSGKAISQSGKHLYFRGPTHYTKAVKVDSKYAQKGEGEIYQLLGGKQLEKAEYILFENEAVAKNYCVAKDIIDIPASFITDYLVALADISSKTDNNYCNDLSCSCGSSEVKTNCIPILVSKTKVQKSFYALPPLPAEAYVNINHFVDLSTLFNSSAITSKLKKLYEENVKAINSKIKYLKDFFKNIEYIYNLLPGTMSTATSNFQECHLYHAQDVAKAINEFVDQYNQFRLKYPFYKFKPYTVDNDKFILLGNLKENSLEYRDIYIKKDFYYDNAITRNTNLPDYYRDWLITEDHIRIICNEISKFTANGPFSLVWENPHAKLIDRITPFYGGGKSGLHSYNSITDKYTGDAVNTSHFTPGGCNVLEFDCRDYQKVVESFEKNNIPIAIEHFSLPSLPSKRYIDCIKNIISKEDSLRKKIIANGVSCNLHDFSVLLWSSEFGFGLDDLKNGIKNTHDVPEYLIDYPIIYFLRNKYTGTENSKYIICYDEYKEEYGVMEFRYTSGAEGKPGFYKNIIYQKIEALYGGGISTKNICVLAGRNPTDNEIKIFELQKNRLQGKHIYLGAMQMLEKLTWLGSTILNLLDSKEVAVANVKELYDYWKEIFPDDNLLLSFCSFMEEKEYKLDEVRNNLYFTSIESFRKYLSNLYNYSIKYEDYEKLKTAEVLCGCRQNSKLLLLTDGDKVVFHTCV